MAIVPYIRLCGFEEIENIEDMIRDPTAEEKTQRDNQFISGRADMMFEIEQLLPL